MLDILQSLGVVIQNILVVQLRGRNQTLVICLLGLTHQMRFLFLPNALVLFVVLHIGKLLILTFARSCGLLKLFAFEFSLRWWVEGDRFCVKIDKRVSVLN